MHSIPKGELSFLHSQNVSPSLSKSHKIYQNKGNSSVQGHASYALAQIGKKTYVIPQRIPTKVSNHVEWVKHHNTGMGKGNTAYYDALGYSGKYGKSKQSKKAAKKDSLKNRDHPLNLKMINEY